MTERQLNLPGKARRKLAASKALLAQGFAEDAVSRAYYTMFYLAEAFLDGEGLAFTSHAARYAHVVDMPRRIRRSSFR